MEQLKETKLSKDGRTYQDVKREDSQSINPMNPMERQTV